ncbi:MAG TPA: DUF4252 domain-containing protein [Candidatus Dormibacteraeota bacterium]|nr:DUF4252 domain-containing protein [Candidatus Dormibacteraeota bacterium]
MSARNRNLLPLVLLLAFPAILRAQDMKLPPDVEKLSAKAKETVEVNMDGPMLHWASKFLSTEDPEERKAAKLVANLTGIYVRSFEFSEEGAYSPAEVEALRAQFRSPEWSRVVGVRSEHEGDNVEVFFKMENEKMAGIVIIAAEAKELTFVNIVGPLEVDQLADLGGEFGIPKLKTKPPSSKPVAKADKGGQK